MEASKLIEYARAWQRAPFLHQGRTRAGVDCVGFIWCVFHECGLPAEDLLGYSREPDGVTLQAHVAKQVQRVKTPTPGDILLMKFVKNPQHLALFAGDTIIHCYAKMGYVCEHRYDEHWKRRTVAVYRHPGVV